jgi:hypothetical protein
MKNPKSPSRGGDYNLRAESLLAYVGEFFSLKHKGKAFNLNQILFLK